MHHRFHFVLPENQPIEAQLTDFDLNVFRVVPSHLKTAGISPRAADRLQRARGRIAQLREQALQIDKAAAQKAARLAQIRSRIQLSQLPSTTTRQERMTEVVLFGFDPETAKFCLQRARSLSPQIRANRNSDHEHDVAKTRDAFIRAETAGLAGGHKTLMNVAVLLLALGQMFSRSHGA